MDRELRNQLQFALEMDAEMEEILRCQHELDDAGDFYGFMRSAYEEPKIVSILAAELERRREHERG